MIKEVAKSALLEFSVNCIQDMSVVIACKCCMDKNTAICESSIKLLAAVLKNYGDGFVKIQP
jgi:hypothetical protein